MLRFVGVVSIIAAGCSQAERQAPRERAVATPLVTPGQDVRCQDSVANGLAPGTFDHGVVTNADLAKELSKAYLRAIFARTDVPVEQVLQRPLIVELRNGIWHVATSVPKDALGMQLTLDICQSNGRVLKLTGAQ